MVKGGRWRAVDATLPTRPLPAERQPPAVCFYHETHVCVCAHLLLIQEFFYSSVCHQKTPSKGETSWRGLQLSTQSTSSRSISPVSARQPAPQPPAEGDTFFLCHRSLCHAGGLRARRMSLEANCPRFRKTLHDLDFCRRGEPTER